jgi:hypothetical protein
MRAKQCRGRGGRAMPSRHDSGRLPAYFASGVVSPTLAAKAAPLITQSTAARMRPVSNR